jgi:hypothetical protein
MNDQYLVVYPRGFIGRATAGLNKETNNATLADKIEAVRYNDMRSREQTTEVYNLNVTDMYDAMVGQYTAHCKLTLIKAIIIEAFRNFGDRDFSEFIAMQRNSRYFTRQHQEFILDTLRFIQTGKRDTSIRTWEIVLRRKLIDDVQSVHQHPRYDKCVSEFFNSSAVDGLPLTGAMHRVISQWMSHRNGHEDLLLTLNLVFGKEFNK